jgi:hypothetical protein
MSDTGLHAGLYNEIRDLAELVDTVISEFALGTARARGNNVQQLAGRLEELTGAPSVGLLLRYLGPDNGSGRRRWGELAAALRQEPAPTWVPARLEQLARILENGRSAALERLRGVDTR